MSHFIYPSIGAEGFGMESCVEEGSLPLPCTAPPPSISWGFLI